MSIYREATARRGESPERELYGYRGETLFAPLDLILFEIDGLGRATMIPELINTEFDGVLVKSGAGQIGNIQSGEYDVPPIITKPFVKAGLNDGAIFHPSFDLEKYLTPRVPKGATISLFEGRKGTVVSDGLVQRLYAGTVSRLNVYEIDLGSFSNDRLHGSQVFIGNPSDMKLLGMLIATAKDRESFSLVFPADQII